MSFRDRPLGHNPIDWLQEKSLAVLEDAARLVDLANEPDTTPWYAKRLHAFGDSMIGRLATMVALIHGTDSEAAAPEQVKPITQLGTAALRDWCERWEVIDPNVAAMEEILGDQAEEETEDKAGVRKQGLFKGDHIETQERRLDVYHAMVGQLMFGKLSGGEQRLLLWLIRDLRLSPWPDAVAISRRFLPTDIGLTVEETLSAYRSLYERGLIERVEPQGEEPPRDRLLLRLIVEWLNESRHPEPYRDEEFGFPGARVGGKPTIGNSILVELPLAVAEAVDRWHSEDRDLKELKALIQERLGEDRAYVESVQFETLNDRTVVAARLRYPWEEDDAVLEQELRALCADWLRRQVLH